MDLEEKIGRLLDFQSRNGNGNKERESEDTTPRIIRFEKLKDGSMQPIYENSINKNVQQKPETSTHSF